MRIHKDQVADVEVMTLNDDESSNVKEASYHFDDATLYINFKGGGVYSYFAVPASTWEGLKSAESKGRYFSSSIKGYYLFKRMDK